MRLLLITMMLSIAAQGQSKRSQHGGTYGDGSIMAHINDIEIDSIKIDTYVGVLISDTEGDSIIIITGVPKGDDIQMFIHKGIRKGDLLLTNQGDTVKRALIVMPAEYLNR